MEPHEEGGRLEAIWIKRARKGPMDPVERATLEEGLGLAGNANRGGRRQVTIIEREVFERIRDEVGPGVEPAMRRANLMVSGVRLEKTRGQVLVVGGCRIRVGGGTRPCNRMEEAHPGLQAALDPEWGGGCYGVVESGGEIRVGDVARLDDADDDRERDERASGSRPRTTSLEESQKGKRSPSGMRKPGSASPPSSTSSPLSSRTSPPTP